MALEQEALPIDGPTDQMTIVMGDVVITPEAMEEMEKIAKAMEEERQRVLFDLSLSIEKKFEERQARRQTKETEWLESMRLYLGSLATDYRSTAGGFFRGNSTNRRPDHNLVKSKCLTAIAQGLSMQFSGGDKNWDLNPPIVADIDQKEAEIKAEAMEAEIYDQLTATKYGFKCRQAYEDRVILGTGILKGPLPSKFAELTYEMTPLPSGTVVPVPTYKVKDKPVLFRVDPWMFFPDDTVNDIDDAEDTIELHPFSKSQLRALTKNPGFFAEAVNDVLKEEPKEYINRTLNEYSSLTSSGSNIFRDKYVVLEYHGPVSRTQLDTLEICPAYESPSETYYGEVWVCQGRVLRVELEAIEGLFQLPYAVCPWEADPCSIFGFGNPQILKDPQRIATQTLHMILDNASASSRSQLVMNREMVEPADGDWTITPGKIWQNTDYPMADVRQAFQFFDVPNQTGALMPVLSLAREFAQEESALPQMVAGLESSQAGSDSATGLGILQQNSTIVSDFLAEQWDDRITEKIITRFYHYNMQYNPKPEILGDFEVDVRSSTEYRNKQLVIRDVEKLSVESAQNPELAQVLNQKELQRVRLSMMHLPSKLIIKSDEQLQQEQEAAAANPQPDPAMIELEIKKQEADTNAAKVQLEMRKMRFEMTLNQQREVMQHDERMSANEARMREAQARVLEAQLNREIEMLKLAQKDEVERARIMADLDKNNAQVETQKFLKGIEAQQRAVDQAQTAEELKMKRETGSGI